MRTFVHAFFMAAAMASPAAARSTDGCARPSLADIVAVQTRLFDLLGRDDKIGFESITLPDFAAIEGGRSLDRKGFFDLVRDAHIRGVKLTWTLRDAHLEADCTLASLRYLNDGTISIQGGPQQPVQWLETAEYRYRGGTWRIASVTSQRTAATEQVGKGSVPSNPDPARRQ